MLFVVTTFISRRDKNQYDVFKSIQKTGDRQKFFKRWAIESFIIYGLLSMIILSIIGQIYSLKVMPDFLVDFSKSVKSIGEMNESDFISGFFKGIMISIVPVLLFGGTIGAFLKEYKDYKDRKSKNNIESEEINFRNLDALIPKNYKERIWGAILSINAGFSEEIFFRVLAPILIYSVTSSVLIAIIGSTIWFGLVHYYQGMAGVFVTFFVGLLMFIVYMITENIWITMLVHAVLDLNGLVFSPWLKAIFANRENSA